VSDTADSYTITVYPEMTKLKVISSHGIYITATVYTLVQVKNFGQIFGLKVGGSTYKQVKSYKKLISLVDELGSL